MIIVLKMANMKKLDMLNMVNSIKLIALTFSVVMVSGKRYDLLTAVKKKN